MGQIKVGDKIPAFSLKNQDDQLVNIEQFIGKPFVVYFYPKDDTPGCTIEACSFRDTYEDFKDVGAEVIGISADSPASHRQFADKHRLPFVLLSDEDKEVQKLFGVPRGMFGLLPGRVTYIFDAAGKVKHIFSSSINMKAHVKESISSLTE